MRVASFNLENLGMPGKTGVATSSRLAVLRPQLKRLKADIVCLQEINGETSPTADGRTLASLDRLIEGTPYQDFERVHSVDPIAGRLSDKHNLVVMSRWPIIGKRQIWHDHVSPTSYLPVSASPAADTATEITWDRPVLYCSVELPDGTTLHVFNLHLRAPLAAPIAGQKTGPFSWRSSSAWAEGFYLAMLKRSGQALETRIEIDRIFDAEPEAQILVCGDFNAAEREVPARIIAASVDDTANGELAGRALVHLERTVPQSQRFSVIHHGERLMLDHILISHALLARYRHFEVHNELLGDELFGFATIGENPESYHAPVVAEFDLDGSDSS
jgi:endonuclease/exonuclease/phosphatase family metal-dependent hydrolase